LNICWQKVNAEITETQRTQREGTAKFRLCRSKTKWWFVTGGANGIGKALCQRFAVEGARAVVVADLDGDAATNVAKEIDGLALKVDVSKEADNLHLVSETIKAFGPIDLFCANAGIAGERGVPKFQMKHGKRSGTST
jgi:NAD(P)-dependent dehydrogenase (short-subunit alcohol dehydrogenase family)